MTSQDLLTFLWCFGYTSEEGFHGKILSILFCIEVREDRHDRYSELNNHMDAAMRCLQRHSPSPQSYACCNITAIRYTIWF